MNDPVIYLGLDIATERDTAALAGVYYHEDKMRLWGHRIWEPPVNIPNQVLPTLRHMLTTHRIGCLAFDPFQFISESQRLANEGYEHLLRKVNQSSENVAFSNVLHEHMRSKTYVQYTDRIRRNHYSWAVARAGERGFSIKKSRQTKHIDVVIAEAMAIYACAEDMQNHHHPSYRDDTHSRSILALP